MTKHIKYIYNIVVVRSKTKLIVTENDAKPDKILKRKTYMKYRIKRKSCIVFESLTSILKCIQQI